MLSGESEEIEKRAMTCSIDVAGLHWKSIELGLRSAPIKARLNRSIRPLVQPARQQLSLFSRSHWKSGFASGESCSVSSIRNTTFSSWPALSCTLARNPLVIASRAQRRTETRRDRSNKRNRSLFLLRKYEEGNDLRKDGYKVNWDRSLLMEPVWKIMLFPLSAFYLRKGEHCNV